MKAPREKVERFERRGDTQKGEDRTPQRFLERLLLPIATEADAEATCAAVGPYIDPRHTQFIVVHPIEDASNELDEEPLSSKRGEANAIFEVVREAFDDTVHPVHTEFRCGTDIVDEIVDSAEKFDATAIGVTPKPEYRWIRRLAGDHSAELCTKSSCPVILFSHPGGSRNPSEGSDQCHTDDNRDECRQLLVPIDGSDPSMAAVEHACSAYPGAEIAVLHVLDSSVVGSHRSTGEPSNDREAIKRVRRRNRRRNAERMFREATELAAEYDVELAPRTITGTRVVRAIISCAENRGTDQIVVGSRGRSGLTRILLGSVAEAVVRRASIPVTVVPTTDETDVEQSETNHVLVSIDDPATEVTALRYAVETFPDAAFTVAHAADPAESSSEPPGRSFTRAEQCQEETRDRRDRTFETVEELADEQDVDYTTRTLTGAVPRAILSCAEAVDTDHIVVGNRNRTRITKTLRGSVSETTVRRSPVPVTVVR